MLYGIVQGDSASHHTPRCDIIAQFPVSNNITQLPGLGLEHIIIASDLEAYLHHIVCL